MEERQSNSSCSGAAGQVHLRVCASAIDLLPTVVTRAVRHSDYDWLRALRRAEQILSQLYKT